MLVDIIYYSNDKIVAIESYNFNINLNKLYNSIGIFMNAIGANRISIKYNNSFKDYLNSYRL